MTDPVVGFDCVICPHCGNIHDITNMHEDCIYDSWKCFSCSGSFKVLVIEYIDPEADEACKCDIDECDYCKNFKYPHYNARIFAYIR